MSTAVPGPNAPTSLRRVIALNAARAWALALLVTGALSCHSSPSSKPPAKHDAGADAPVACTHDAGTKKTLGTACGCDGDCDSGFCVDNVCCNSACTETCKSCNTRSAPGICSFVAAGDPPRTPSVCPKSDSATCGLDGTCNGNGACRSYVSGTVCQAGTCDGASVGGIRVCDGSGNCTPGPATICAPFNCDAKTNSCVLTCSSDADCAPNVKCVNGSCGKRPAGGLCTAANECASGFCADGVCCNVACTGPCVSCNQSGRVGTCWPTVMGVSDPHKLCTTTDQSTCGQTGACDGLGGCSKYAPETVCVSPSCTGNRMNTAGTCDGLGTCRPQGIENCDPYRCTNNACVSHCASDADCVAGHSCVNGSCGPKSPGQPCSAASECASNFCADGVCCTTACTGSCRSCSLSTSLGTCAPVPAGAGDPHRVCVDDQASSCGTDGTCDGAGGCHKYPPGTECGAEKCAAGIYTPVSTCDATGNCRAPDAITCGPYVCNGARCFTACATDTACSTGNVCVQGSCGLKPNGAFCSGPAECQSDQCAQGVCCATACAGACMSCALTGTMGLCTAVPNGLPDPAGLCSDKGAASCGTDGRCQAGACHKYQQGTACAGATCPTPGSTFTAGGTCDGAGTCTIPAAASCFPFTCGLNACKSTCASDADCAPPATCNAGSCGLKPNGAVCQAGSECQSTFCAQGVCCAKACTGTCMSCALASSKGTCSPVAAGAPDPAGGCADKGAASCATTGFCDGSGACALYPTGTQCAPPSCPSGSVTATLAATCNGAGKCQTASTQSCLPFACSAGTQSCVSVCAADSDCAPGQFCNTSTGSCGLKRLGQICNLGSECASGNCVDGVCCSSPSCGICQVCNVAGNPGSCQPVPAGTAEPHQGCTPVPPCGFDGTCNGAGNCRNTGAGTSCGAASCTGSTALPAGSCDGAGLCVQTPQACPDHLVCGGTACLTSCTADGDCVAGYTCQSGVCTNLKALGTACASNAECLSGMCTDGVCCSTASCGTCASCSVSGKAGACAPVAAGTASADCPTTPASGCGTNGTCDGAGQCATYPAGTSCAPAACTAGTTLVGASKCDGAGHCAPGPSTDCTPQACANAACTSGCATAADCAPGYSCGSPPTDGGADAAAAPQCTK